MIIRYVKVKGKPIGCVIGTESGGVGWSLCCKKDIFDKKTARLIALGRAANGFKTEIPQKIRTTFNEVFDRLNILS